MDPPEVIERIKEGREVLMLLARQLRRTFGEHVRVEDLESYGSEALLLSARTFDPSRGIPFRRWANLRIRGAMIDGIRQQGDLPRRVYRMLRAMQESDAVREGMAEDPAPATAEAADEALSQKLSASAMAMAIGFLTMTRGSEVDTAAADDESPEDKVASAELVAAVRGAIAERPDVERRLLERHYFDDVTLEEAGRELGLSKSWASRIHARAVDGVVKSMRRAKIG